MRGLRRREKVRVSPVRATTACFMAQLAGDLGVEPMAPSQTPPLPKGPRDGAPNDPPAVISSSTIGSAAAA